MNDNLFHLLIKSREGVLYEGETTSITSYNEKGKFDVLALHANFISLIQKNIVIRKPNGETQEFKLDNALLRIKENNVEVYLGISAMKPSEFKLSDEFQVIKDLKENEA